MLSVDNLHLGTGYPTPVYGFVEGLPGEDFSLTASPIQPFERTLNSPAVKVP